MVWPVADTQLAFSTADRATNTASPAAAASNTAHAAPERNAARPRASNISRAKPVNAGSAIGSFTSTARKAQIIAPATARRSVSPFAIQQGADQPSTPMPKAATIGSGTGAPE